MSEEMGNIIQFSEDVSSAEKPPLLPIQRYPAEIRSAEAKIGGSGKRYAELGLYISPEDFPADFPAEFYPDGVNLYFRRVSLEDDAGSRYRLGKLCRSLGVPVTTSLDMNDFIGKTPEVEVVHEQYEGEDQMVAKKLYAADE